MASITLTLTGETSSLNSHFYPEIELDEKSNYSCCLLDFFSYNSIPNINERNNKFYYILEKKLNIDDESDVAFKAMKGYKEIEKDVRWKEYKDLLGARATKCVVVPIGVYEIDDITRYLNNEFEKQNVKIAITTDKNTMKCSINSEFDIDFTKNDCIGSFLGFSRGLLQKGENKSDKLIDIQHINNLRIDCDLVSGSFHNGKRTHTIHEFNPSVDPGYKISEHPKHLVYLPIARRRISTVNVSIVDQDGRLVDFRGEQITCRLHIKRDT